MTRPKRVAILVNILAPYRAPVYQGLAEAFETRVFFGGEEENRSTWQGVKALFSGVSVQKSWGFTFRMPYRRAGQVFDYRRIHITPGFLWDLLAFRPDAVITTEMGFRTLVALLYGLLMRRPVWVWWGGTLHTERSTGRVRRILRGLITAWARHWISYGETSTAYLRSLGVPRSDILQIQNCVDEQAFARATAAPAAAVAPRPVLLYVGQLIRRKGVDLLLQAAAAVQHAGYQFSLLLVGGGPEQQSLAAMAADLGLQHVQFLPGRRPEEMPSVYRSADLLVFPTLEDVWGLVVNEALWSGLPVLCSVYAGCAQELCSADNIFDPLDHDQFVTALRRALDGRLQPADPSRLRSSRQVSDMIIQDIQAVLPAR